MSSTSLIAEKVCAVMEEMKATGLWQKSVPSWVNEYQERSIATENDFSEWLQFVYLPNLAHQPRPGIKETRRSFIVPQALRFFGNDLNKGKLLRLLVELDSI